MIGLFDGLALPVLHPGPAEERFVGGHVPSSPVPYSNVVIPTRPSPDRRPTAQHPTGFSL